MQGLIARMTKDDAKARATFTAARAEQEKLVRAHPDDAGALCVLGLIDAALGTKRGSAARRPARDRAASRGKGCDQRHAHNRVFSKNRRLGWRQRSRLRTTCHRHPLSERRRPMAN